MTAETRHLLVALKAVNQQIPTVVLTLLDGSLSVERQVEFGRLLVELGELIRWHAHDVRSPTILEVTVRSDGETL
ncbi:MAG: hypothetical protein ACRDRL_26175 [Sciscionella sp.]